MKKKIIFTSIIAFIIISINIISNAAIEIKEGTVKYTNINISNAYKLCYDLRNYDTTLGNNNLDPHLALNKDWGAVAYLSMSSYGTVRSYSGTEITINEKNYYSTTGNATGVINFGKTSSYTAGILDGAESTDNIKNLFDNKETKYVEKLSITADANSTKGQALYETYDWYKSSGTTSSSWVTSTSPVLKRSGVVRFIGTSGNANIETFRPVIWNK